MPEALKDLAFTLMGWLFTPLAVGLSVGARALWRRSGRWSKRRRISGRGLAAVMVMLAAPLLVLGGYGLWTRYRPHPAAAERTLHPGIHYRVFTAHDPRPMVVHVVTVRLDTPGLSLVPTPASPGSRCLPARTASSFMAEFDVQLAINTQFFYPCPDPDTSTPFEAKELAVGQPLRPIGRYVAEGELVVDQVWRGTTVYFDREGHASLYEPPAVVHHAISGRHRLVEEGVVNPGADDGTLAPRVALGFDAARRRMTIVVVDGRQRGYSEGISLPEMARLLIELGLRDAIELDGGGSATLVSEGEGGDPEVLNSPIHTRLPGRERPVATHLGVRVRGP